MVRIVGGIVILLNTHFPGCIDVTDLEMGHINSSQGIEDDMISVEKIPWAMDSSLRTNLQGLMALYHGCYKVQRYTSYPGYIESLNSA